MDKQDELKSYRDELKESEKQIKLLIAKVKHIKEHIKYLEAQKAETDGENNGIHQEQ